MSLTFFLFIVVCISVLCRESWCFLSFHTLFSIIVYISSIFHLVVVYCFSYFVFLSISLLFFQSPFVLLSCRFSLSAYFMLLSFLTFLSFTSWCMRFIFVFTHVLVVFCATVVYAFFFGWRLPLSQNAEINLAENWERLASLKCY